MANKYGESLDILMTGAEIPGMHSTAEKVEVQSQQDLVQWMIDVIGAAANDPALIKVRPDPAQQN